MHTTHYRTCNLCEAMCGMVITVEEGRITGIRGDEEDPFSRGHICPKGPAMREVYEDPDRLRHPMRRTRVGWQRISWEEAFTEAAARISEVRAKHGRDAIGLYAGNPTVHNHGATIGLQGFARALGSKSRFDANSQDANPKLFACMLMYGDQASIPIPDVDRTDHLLIFGANPAASNGSLLTLGDVKGRLRGIRDRGGRIVLVDPRRSETAAWCDAHHFVRPGSDAALLLGILQVLFTDGKIDRATVGESTRGLDELATIALRFPPERVADATGLSPSVIRTIARDFAAAPRAVAYGRVGICHGAFSSIASWLCEALNVVTGNFDRDGGAMFTRPAIDLGALARRLVGNRWGRWKSRVRGLPEFGGQLPGAVMAEEMDTPGDGQIRAFITIAGNPVLSTPNGERLATALAKLDFMVAIDPFINETTRHAHLILPPLNALERGHYDLVFHALAVRNTAKWSPPVMPAPDDGRDDWAILYELGMRLGGMRFGAPLLDGAARLVWRAGWSLTADRVIDLLLRAGAYGGRFVPFRGGLSLAALRKTPHGIDLGPLLPAGREKVRTQGGKVDLAPAPLVADLPRLERWLDGQRANGLVLIGRRHLRSNNSWMHNCPSLVKGPDRSGLLIHPTDADRLGLTDGQAVRVRSRVGAVAATVRRSDEIMPGVVSLPHGYGHAAAADTLRVAGTVAGPNINALTDEELVDPLTGTAALSGVPVTIEATD
ncbi:MAG: molybdopterin oxidoreductase family protein [Myxococcales bacterium]|nr:molybdopterin oxidoreductase family protein [Myxococcales bacterium]